MNDQTRSMAAHAFNAAWDALEADEFISAVELARESLRLWREVGGHRELSVGEWMVGRTQAFAGNFAAARVAAAESQAHLDALGGEAEDWLHASAAELHARAHSNEPASINYHHFYETAETLIAAIHDAEDRELIRSQFSDLPKPA